MVKTRSNGLEGEAAPAAPEAGNLTRRQVLGATTAAGATAALAGVMAHAASQAPSGDDSQGVGDPKLAHEIHRSTIFALAGESMDDQRVQAMRGLLETNLKEIELLRQFDPDEEEPVIRFRPW